MYANILFALLSLHLLARARRQDGSLTDACIVKIADCLSAFLQRLDSHNLKLHFAPDPRHVVHDQRKRKTLFHQITQCLG